MTLKIFIKTNQPNFNEVSNLMTKLSRYAEDLLCDYEIKPYGYYITYPTPKNKDTEENKSIMKILNDLMSKADNYELF
jgi:hypothetical protein